MRFLAVFLCLALVLPAHAAEDVPEAIQGRWVSPDETCDRAMTVSATTLVYPDGRIDDVYFVAEESVIRLPEEAVAYEYIEDDDRLIFRPEGFGMGSASPMQRCPDRTSILERRCGWLSYLSPGDWRLVDADRSWILSQRGEMSVPLHLIMDMVPSFDPEQYVATGEHYGYGCACMTVTTDTAKGRIVGITSTKRLPLATCQGDKSLPSPVAAQ